MKTLKEIIYSTYLFSFLLPLFKLLNVPVIKEWSWLTVVAPFWGATCIGMIIVWILILVNSYMSD